MGRPRVLESPIGPPGEGPLSHTLIVWAPLRSCHVRHVDALILEAIMFQVTDQRSDDASSRGEKGQGLAEYALILGLIALIAIGAVMFLGQSMNTMFSNLGTSI